MGIGYTASEMVSNGNSIFDYLQLTVPLVERYHPHPIHPQLVLVLPLLEARREVLAYA